MDTVLFSDKDLYKTEFKSYTCTVYTDTVLFSDKDLYKSEFKSYPIQCTRILVQG